MKLNIAIICIGACVIFKYGSEPRCLFSITASISSARLPAFTFRSVYTTNQTNAIHSVCTLVGPGFLTKRMRRKQHCRTWMDNWSIFSKALVPISWALFYSCWLTLQRKAMVQNILVHNSHGILCIMLIHYVRYHRSQRQRHRPCHVNRLGAPLTLSLTNSVDRENYLHSIVHCLLFVSVSLSRSIHPSILNDRLSWWTLQIRMSKIRDNPITKWGISYYVVVSAV